MRFAVVGSVYPNKDGSNRLFEIAMCLPGEPVQDAGSRLSRQATSAVALCRERCGALHPPRKRQRISE